MAMSSMTARLITLAFCGFAAWMCLAQDACTVDVEEDMAKDGHAMLQVAEQAPQGRKISSHAPSHQSKAESKSSKAASKAIAKLVTEKAEAKSSKAATKAIAKLVTKKAETNSSKAASKAKLVIKKAETNSSKATSKAKPAIKKARTNSSKASSKAYVWQSSLKRLTKKSRRAKAHRGSSKKSRKAKTPDASNVALSESGYRHVAEECCNYEMEEYIRRTAMNMDLKVCNEGGLQGIVPFHVCENKQNFSTLEKEINAAQTGVCPWTAPKDGECKKMSVACGQTSDPMAHRRRNCGRADSSGTLDLEMQNAATQEFLDSKCGTHQLFSDVASAAGVLKSCNVKGDLTENQTAIKACLNECCETTFCIGISVSDSGAMLQKGFYDAEPAEGTISYLHRQR